jgi:hypothetical protein
MSALHCDDCPYGGCVPEPGGWCERGLLQAPYGKLVDVSGEPVETTEPRFALLPPQPLDRALWPEVYGRLVCREVADGTFMEHDHRDGGHCFPFTRLDALRMLNGLIKLLYHLE